MHCRSAHLKKTFVATVVALLVFVAFNASAAELQLPAIMVLNIKYEEAASPGIAKILTELVLQNLHDLKIFRVIGQKDIDQMLDTQQRKQLAGCNDTSCLVEVAGAMGTKYTLDGTVGVVGQSTVLSLSLVDVTRAAVVSRKTSVVKGERDQLFATVHKLIGDLMEPLPEYKRLLEERDARPMAPYKLWGHVGLWSGVAVAVIGGVFTALAYTANDDYAAGKDPVSNRDAVDRNNGIAVTSYVFGTALIAAGVTLLVLEPGEARSGKIEITITPVVCSQGSFISLGGGW